MTKQDSQVSLPQCLEALQPQVRALPLQQVSLAQATGRVAGGTAIRLSPTQLAARAARGESVVNCVGAPRVGVLLAQPDEDTDSVAPGARFLQASLHARGLSPTSWPATRYPGREFDAALRSLQEGFDVVFAVLPSNALTRLPASAASSTHWALSVCGKQRGRVMMEERDRQWTVKVEADPLSMIAAWHFAIRPLLDLLEGLPGVTSDGGAPVTLIGVPETGEVQWYLVELAWLRLNDVNVRRLGHLLPSPEWQSLPAQLGLVELVEGQGARLIWQSPEAANG